MMIYVNALGSNYSEIPTGEIECQSVEAFASEWGLEISGNTLRAEWGNGEGYDEFEYRVTEGSDNYEIVAEGLDNLTVSYEDAISSAEHMAQVWAVEWVERGDKIYVGGELYARRID